jgi:hypothetical protein
MLDRLDSECKQDETLLICPELAFIIFQSLAIIVACLTQLLRISRVICSPI